MALSDDEKAGLIGNLTANASSRAARAWQGVDLDAAGDDELIAFNEYRKMLDPAEKGVACSCGRKHVYNFDAGAWKESGTPKAAKLPATVQEFLANGGGSQEDKEAWQTAQNMARQRRNDVLERLTANMDEAKRTTFWDKHQNTKVEDLEEILDLMPKRSEEQRPAANYYGAQGAPPSGGIAANVQPLIPPVLEFTRKTG